SIGSMADIEQATADEVGVPVDKLRDEDVKKEYAQKRYKEYQDNLSDEDKEYLKEKWGKIGLNSNTK
ncbi:hypothetical protein H8D04_01265, partial [bacterium]|nr:hypothetical protein [bacterium]